MIYDYSGLNAQSFQRLIESLAISTFGASGSVFAAGPDGGRDFAFTGKPNGYEGRDWNGYLVLQAKFRSKLEGGDKDIKWLTGELDKELSAYNDEKSGRLAPNYYIIATNVSLSGADGRAGKDRLRKGGITKLQEYFKTWKNSIGLTDCDFWSAEKISALLDINSSLRSTYAAWITPGDVLSKLLANLEEPSFAQAIQSAMRKALPIDQFVNLKDAGDASDQGLRASQVFIDLPVTVNSNVQIHSVQPLEREYQNVLATLVDRSKDRLDPASVSGDDAAREVARRNLIVLLGGPGQGKSTLSKFFVQLQRATLIGKSDGFAADPNLTHLVPEIIARAKEEKVSDVGARYPVHINLPNFADEMVKRTSDGHSLTILGYMALTLSKDADTIVTKEQLRKWLKETPWLILLGRKLINGIPKPALS